MFKDRRDNSIKDLSKGPVTFKNHAAYAKSDAGQANLKQQGKGLIARKVVAPIAAKIADKVNGNKPITVAKKGSTYTDRSGNTQSWDNW